MTDKYHEKLDKLQRDVDWIIRYLLKRDEPINPPPYMPSSSAYACPTCGMVFDGSSSYYCPRNNCPTFTKTSC